MSKAKVAILRTSPRTVLADYHKLMNLAGYQDVIDKTADTALKINISWQHYYPGCSTAPWQIDYSSLRVYRTIGAGISQEGTIDGAVAYLDNFETECLDPVANETATSATSNQVRDRCSGVGVGGEKGTAGID